MTSKNTLPPKECPIRRSGGLLLFSWVCELINRMTSQAAEWRLCGGWKLRAADFPWPLRSTNTTFQGDDVDKDACLQSMVANVFRFFALPSRPWRMMA